MTENNTPNPQLENTRLLELLHNYHDDETSGNYNRVMDELTNGNAYLLLPTINSPGKGWRSLEEDESLKITSVIEQDGLTVLGAFTGEDALLKWTLEETEYTAMPSQEVLEMCKANGVDRIVIDSQQPTMFVLQRNINVESETIQEETKVLVSTPKNTIEGDLLERFRKRLANVSVVQEVYQFIMTRGRETTLVLAFRLDRYNDNTRKACQYAVDDALKGETMEQGLDLFYLQNDDWYETAKGIENSLVYKR